MHAAVLITINLCTKFQDPSFTHSKEMMGTKNFKIKSHEPD